jgi:hypothetical protein
MRENLREDSKIFKYEVVFALDVKYKVCLLTFLEKVFDCTLFSLSLRLLSFT